MSIMTTPVARQLGAEVPVFGFAHSLEVTAAVSRAGGVGVWGATRNTPEEIRDGLGWLAEEIGDLPYAVDLVLPAKMPERDDRAAIEVQIPDEHRAFMGRLRDKYEVPDDGLPGLRSRFVRSEEVATEQIREVLTSDVPIVAFGVGSPQHAIDEAKATGKTVVSLIGTPEHARRALARGADILVAQGYDAGAHTGDIGTFSLVPKIVDLAGDTPVLVAGGVATGRHIAAALALGGQGVWLGTAWLFTVEHELDDLILAKLAAADLGDTVRSRADSGKTLRQIRTAWTDEWAQPDAPTPLPMPRQDILVGDFLGAVERHRVELLLKSEAGQSVGYFDRRVPVAEVVDELVREFTQARERLSSMGESTTG